MIAKLEGVIAYIADKFLVIDVSGVGYKVFTTTDSISSVSLGDHTSFWIYTAVRENSIELYGFKNTSELSFFELLLDVSGIGPKSALGILGIAPIDALRRAIATGDTTYLNKVSGIGRKTSEKIIVELKDKFVMYRDEDISEGKMREEEDVLEALKSLGYSQNEARNALKQVSPSLDGASQKIKEALKILGGKRS